MRQKINRVMKFDDQFTERLPLTFCNKFYEVCEKVAADYPDFAEFWADYKVKMKPVLAVTTDLGILITRTDAFADILSRFSHIPEMQMKNLFPAITGQKLKKPSAEQKWLYSALEALPNSCLSEVRELVHSLSYKPFTEGLENFSITRRIINVYIRRAPRQSRRLNSSAENVYPMSLLKSYRDTRHNTSIDYKDIPEIAELLDISIFWMFRGLSDDVLIYASKPGIEPIVSDYLFMSPEKRKYICAVLDKMRRGEGIL